MNPNNTAISTLKLSIERRQVDIESIKHTIGAMKRALAEAENTKRTLEKHKEDDIRQLAIIANVENVNVDWHALGEPCDDGDCQECCEHMSLDGGICEDCGADRTEHLMARAYDLYKDRD